MIRQQVRLVSRDSKRLSVFALMSLDNRLAAYPTEEITSGAFVVQCMEDRAPAALSKDKPTVIVLDNAQHGMPGMECPYSSL